MPKIQILLLGLTLLMASCEPSGTILLDDDDVTGDDDDDDDVIPEIEMGDWEPCALIPGQDESDAECAQAWMPLDYADLEGEELAVLVKRFQQADEPTGQLWLLHGGPGASALDDMAYLAYDLPEQRPDLAIYAIDHRGIGGSGRLGCPDQEHPDSDWGESVSDAEWADCIYAMTEEWGDGLDQINVTNSARDIGTLIEHLAGEEQVFLWGGSYGTYLAQRYLQLFPDQPDGVVIDGISPPGQGFMEYDLGMEITGEKMMDACAAEPSCAAHFDGDPWTTAQDVVASFDHGHCADLGADAGTIRYLLGALLMYDRVRDVVPALIHRMDRCSVEDMQVIVNLWYSYFGAMDPLGSAPRGLPSLPCRPPQPGQSGNDGDGYSQQLFFQVATSDMWDHEGGPTEGEAVAAWETYTMATGLTGWVAEMVPRWPSVPDDEYTDGFSEYDGPLLMLQGGLDPATPVEFAQAVGDHYTAELQTWALFPHGAHGLIQGSILPDGSHCGEQLYLEFLDDPYSALDTGCIDDTLPVQFDGYPEYNHYFLGTVDAWGD